MKCCIDWMGLIFCLLITPVSVKKRSKASEMKYFLSHDFGKMVWFFFSVCWHCWLLFDFETISINNMILEISIISSGQSLSKSLNLGKSSLFHLVVTFCDIVLTFYILTQNCDNFYISSLIYQCCIHYKYHFDTLVPLIW